MREVRPWMAALDAQTEPSSPAKAQPASKQRSWTSAKIKARLGKGGPGIAVLSWGVRLGSPRADREEEGTPAIFRDPFAKRARRRLQISLHPAPRLPIAQKNRVGRGPPYGCVTSVRNHPRFIDPKNSSFVFVFFILSSMNSIAASSSIGCSSLRRIQIFWS